MNSRQTLRILALTLPLTGVLLVPVAQAKPVDTSRFQGVVGECAPGDELVADFTTTEKGRTLADGTETLHLKLTGTVTRTGTGMTGKYSENQRDWFYPDGSERYVGVLSKLVVRGGGGFTWAGEAYFPVDGEPVISPGLQPLMEADFTTVVCDALA